MLVVRRWAYARGCWPAGYAINAVNAVMILQVADLKLISYPWIAILNDAPILKFRFAVNICGFGIHGIPVASSCMMDIDCLRGYGLSNNLKSRWSLLCYFNCWRHTDDWYPVWVAHIVVSVGIWPTPVNVLFGGDCWSLEPDKLTCTNLCACHWAGDCLPWNR
jgi:hypothetical protein